MAELRRLIEDCQEHYASGSDALETGQNVRHRNGDYVGAKSGWRCRPNLQGRLASRVANTKHLARFVSALCLLGFGGIVFSSGLTEQPSTANPSGRKVRNCVDEWGRGKWVSGVKTMAECASGAQPGSGESYVSAVEYAAGGGMGSWNLGTGRASAVAYNERNQPVRMRLGTNLGGALGCGAVGDDWCIELGYGAVGTENNGNIREQKIWARKADNGYLNLRQTYDFDGLNRLTAMGESVLGGGSGGGSWTETNQYDRWGNRWASNTGPQSFLTPAEAG